MSYVLTWLGRRGIAQRGSRVAELHGPPDLGRGPVDELQYFPAAGVRVVRERTTSMRCHTDSGAGSSGIGGSVAAKASRRASAAARLVALGLLTGRGGMLMLTEAGLRNSLPTWPSKETA